MADQAIDSRVYAANRRFLGIWRERQSFEAKWQELSNYINPTGSRFLADEHNKGNRSRVKILDAVATRALGVAKAGLMAGMASPSRPWFALGIQGDGAEGNHGVSVWLEAFRDALLSIYDRSNFYQSLSTMFGDEMTYGTSAMAMFDDAGKVIRCQTFPVGSYAIGQDSKANVTQFVREFTQTVEQAANEYGAESLSDGAKNSLRRGALTTKITIRHAIWPRAEANIGRLGAIGLPFEELFWEHRGTAGGGQEVPDFSAGAMGVGGSQGSLLRESGYHEFPIIVARWDKNDDDVWGTNCPAMNALGDIKELQAQRRAYSNALAKIVNPPLRADPSLDGRPVSHMAGEVTFSGASGSRPGVEPIHEVRLQISEVLDGMERLRDAIREAFLLPIWQMLLNDSRAGHATAEEIRARLQEKADVLGPILERHSDDVFDKVIDRSAAIVLRRSEPLWAMGEKALIGPPPDELSGTELRPVYISEIAQSQRLQGLVPIERHVNFLAAYSAIDPTVLDVMDADALMREHADVVGVPSKLSRPEEDVQALRAQRNEQQQALAMAEAAPKLASAAKDMSQAGLQQAPAFQR